MPKVDYTLANPLDVLIVGYYQGDKLMFASKVRNGFVPRLRREVWRKRKEFETATYPFANLRNILIRQCNFANRPPLELSCRF